MVKKSKVYTRTGDKGTTGLVGGSRISKGEDLIDLYGEVDELNSHLGYAICLNKKEELNSFFKKIQVKLFDLGSNLACEQDKRLQFKLPQITDDDIKELESEIDRLDSTLEPLKYFVLPGGDRGSTYFHICRTVCRRIERKLVKRQEEVDDLPANSTQYMNRLSDYFFVVSRYLNKESGEKENYWIPNS